MSTDGLDFPGDGTIVATIDGTRHTLRRPKVRDYRRIYEDAQRLQRAVKAAHEADDETFDPIGVLADWTRLVFDTLSDAPLPADVEDWPFWLTSATLPRQFLVHWQTVPLAPGVE